MYTQKSICALKSLLYTLKSPLYTLKRALDTPKRDLHTLQRARWTLKRAKWTQKRAIYPHHLYPHHLNPHHLYPHHLYISTLIIYPHHQIRANLSKRPQKLFSRKTMKKTRTRRQTTPFRYRSRSQRTALPLYPLCVLPWPRLFSLPLLFSFLWAAQMCL